MMKLYEKLLDEFGHQHWWPADTKYEVVVGAILTQNTNWRNVEKALDNLREKDALSEQAILKTPMDELEQLIRPSGFYRQKAERLKSATRKWLELKDSRKDAQELRSEWLSVKGIGKETADSILLYAMDRTIFVIDSYTRRFCKAELGKEFKEYDEYQQYFESNLPEDLELYKEYHALIVEWGKENSKKKKLES
jgi:endonuclease-3 related protein